MLSRRSKLLASLTYGTISYLVEFVTDRPSPGRLPGGPGYGKEVKLQKGKDEDP